MARLIKNFFSQIFFPPEKNKRNFKSFKPEILCLEDRTVPAVVTVEPNGLVQFKMEQEDNLTNLYSKISRLSPDSPDSPNSILSLNIEGSKITNSLSIPPVPIPTGITNTTLPTGITVNNNPTRIPVGNFLNIDVSQIPNFSGLNFLGSSSGNSIVVNQFSSNKGLDLSTLANGSPDQSVNFDLSQAATNSLTIQTQIIPKASGNISLISPLTFLPNGLNVVGEASTILYLGGKIIADSNISFSNDISKVELKGPVTLDLRGNSTFSIPSTVDPTSADYPIRLIGTGKLLLTGNSEATLGNNFIIIENGSLEVNSTGKLSPESTISIIGGILTGDGTVGKVVATGGVFDLTASTITSKLTPTDVTLSGNSVLKVALNSNLDQNFQILHATGDVSILGNSILQISNFTTNETNLKTLIEKNIDVIKSSTKIEGKFSNPFQRSSVVIQSGINKGTTLSFSISPLSISPPVNKTLQVQLVFFSPPTQGATFVNPPKATGVQDFSVFGAGAGGGPEVVVTLNEKDNRNKIEYRFFAYDSAFTGGVKVAIGNLIGDDTPEVVTVPGPGGGPHIKIFQLSNGIYKVVDSFFAFEPSFTGGSYITLGNISGNSSKDIVVSAGPGGGPRVQVFKKFDNNAYNPNPIMDFFAYGSDFRGGVVVSTGNRLASNLLDEIVTAPASNGGWNIRSFSYSPGNSSGNESKVEDFFVDNNTASVGGLSIAIAKFNNGLNDLLDDICVAINLPLSNDPKNPLRILGILGDNNALNQISTTALFVFPVFPNSITIGVSENKDKVKFLIVNAGPDYPSYAGFYGYNTATKQFFLSDIGLIFDAEFKGGLFSNSSLV